LYNYTFKVSDAGVLPKNGELVYVRDLWM